MVSYCEFLNDLGVCGPGGAMSLARSLVAGSCKLMLGLGSGGARLV